MDLMMFKWVAAAGSGVLGFVFILPYIIDIFKGKTQPHMYSWLIWTLVQSLAVFLLFISGGGLGGVGLLVGTLMCFIVFVLSFKYGTKNVTQMDGLCLFAALIAIGFWLVTKDAFVSILLVSTIDLIGNIPTFRKSYYEPETETLSTWVMSSTSNLLALLALQEYSWTTVLYLLSIFGTTSTCAIIIYWRRRS